MQWSGNVTAAVQVRTCGGEEVEVEVVVEVEVEVMLELELEQELELEVQEVSSKQDYSKCVQRRNSALRELPTMASRSADITRQTAGSAVVALCATAITQFCRNQHQPAHRRGRPGQGRCRDWNRIFGSHDLPAVQIFANVSRTHLLRMISFS
jgi:hypothetical protein